MPLGMRPPRWSVPLLPRPSVPRPRPSSPRPRPPKLRPRPPTRPRPPSSPRPPIPRPRPPSSPRSPILRPRPPSPPGPSSPRPRPPSSPRSPSSSTSMQRIRGVRWSLTQADNYGSRSLSLSLVRSACVWHASGLRQHSFPPFFPPFFSPAPDSACGQADWRTEILCIPCLTAHPSPSINTPYVCSTVGGNNRSVSVSTHTVSRRYAYVPPLVVCPRQTHTVYSPPPRAGWHSQASTIHPFPANRVNSRFRGAVVVLTGYEPGSTSAHDNSQSATVSQRKLRLEGQVVPCAVPAQYEKKKMKVHSPPTA